MKKKSKSHVVQLKEKVKSRILGKRETPLSAYQTEQPQHSDVPPAQEAHDFVSVVQAVSKGLVESGAFKGTSFLPVEQHGTTNDAARQVIISRVKTKS